MVQVGRSERQRGMGSDIIVGTISFAVAGVLLFVAMPDRRGISPRFLRFKAAPIVYPPVILVFWAIGAASLIAPLLRGS